MLPAGRAQPTREGWTSGGSADEIARDQVARPGATLTNDGTLRSGIGDFPNKHVLNGNITNDSVINIDAPAEYGANASGTLDNAGQLFLNLGAGLMVDAGQSSTVINDTGGSIANQGGTGSLTVFDGNTFQQGNGEVDAPTSGNNFDNYSVIVNAVTSPASLTYTGTGTPSSSTIEAEGQINLSGGPLVNQSLFVNGDCYPNAAAESLATAASGFTNAGTIDLTGTCDSGLKLTAGTLTNTGTLTTAPTQNNVSREINGSLSNSGTLTIDGATAFDGSGASLTQTDGNTMIAPTVHLDASTSGAVFELQGGVLSGGGATEAQSAVFNGSVDNTGGNVIPGSAISPGLLTFDGSYTQGSGGTLTEVIDGPASGGPGAAYGELGLGDSATLAGTLAITTLAEPSVNDFDTVLSANPSVSGQFSDITDQFPPGGPLPPGWTGIGYQPDYQASYMGVRAEPAAGLRVARTGPGTGTVASSPAGINCGTQCDAPYFESQTVTLTARPGAGSGLTGWSGACSGLALTCKVNMSQARSVTARFGHRTTTRLTSSRNPAKVGSVLTYTASVSPRPAGGKVSFTDGGHPIGGCGGVSVTSTGKATCKVIYRSAGTHRIRASYLGDSSDARSASSPLTEKVRA
jgi:hypothetical protein